MLFTMPEEKPISGSELMRMTPPPMPLFPTPEESEDQESPKTPISHHIYREDSFIGSKVKKPTQKR